MTVQEAADVLNVTELAHIYRLLSRGVLRGRKENGRWLLDADSVHERARRVALKRSSKLNADAQRAARLREAGELFS